MPVNAGHHLAVCASALALIFTVAMTALETSVEAMPASHEPTASKPLRRDRPIDATRFATLFELTGERLVPEQRALPPFPARLLGTLSSAAPERSVASLLLPSGRARSVWAGDRVLDAEVVAIERDAIVVRRAGVLQRLTLRPAESIPTIAPLTRTGPADYVVTRSEVMHRLDDLSGLSREVQLVPAFRDGRAIGFRFVRIAPESAIAKLGLQPGDVVRAVNGQPLDSVQRLLALAATLDRPTQVDLEIDRAGQRLTHHYRLD